jgi:ADP-ribosylglycohydrolase
LSVFLARTGQTKSQIRESIQSEFGYDLDRTVDQIRPGYRFDVSCRGSVPESIIAFLDSTCFEDAVRKAVSLGGDSDTMACMAGAIAEAYYGGVPKDIVEKVRSFLTDDLWDITSAFCEKYYDLSIATLDD